jgi:hypothetical protein
MKQVEPSNNYVDLIMPPLTRGCSEQRRVVWEVHIRHKWPIWTTPLCSATEWAQPGERVATQRSYSWKWSLNCISCSLVWIELCPLQKDMLKA